jgi:hypothetical protein
MNLALLHGGELIQDLLAMINNHVGDQGLESFHISQGRFVVNDGSSSVAYLDGSLELEFVVTT